ncbi:MAG: oxygenase MpaB family protein [Pedobacter sp.]|nr:oxygenase MpaB family protein [Pedobacter sp.]
MTKYENKMTYAQQSIEMDWPAPLTPKEWDERFPGILDNIGIFGGPANVIMQLINLPVGYGVVESPLESSSVLKHPIKRARTTATYLAVAMLGNTEEKLIYRQAVNKSHAHIRSTEKSPVKYNAFTPELQLWVAACLYWGFANVNTRFSKSWTSAHTADLYHFAAPLGTTLQVRTDMWPADAQAFQEYFDSNLEKFTLDEPVRNFLRNLIELKHRPPVVSALLGPVVRFITTGFLPPRVREEMHYSWTEKDQRKFDRFLRIAGTINRLLPRPVRQAGTLLVMADFRRRVRKGLPLT